MKALALILDCLSLAFMGGVMVATMIFGGSLAFVTAFLGFCYVLRSMLMSFDMHKQRSAQVRMMASFADVFQDAGKNSPVLKEAMEEAAAFGRMKAEEMCRHG